MARTTYADLLKEAERLFDAGYSSDNVLEILLGGNRYTPLTAANISTWFARMMHDRGDAKTD